MLIDVKTTGQDKEYDGVCPECHEHTTAGESCCGRGAYVEGGLITDESAQEDAENPMVCIRLLTNANEQTARELHSALFKAKVSSTMFSHSIQDNRWNVNAFFLISEIPQNKS